MAREGLLIHLSSGLRKASGDNITVKKKDIPIADDEGNTMNVTMEILPVEEETLGKNDQLFMITLKEASGKLTTPPFPGNNIDEVRYKELEDELFQTREELQYTIEDLKTSNEELKSSSEEVMSAYEELQSTNEELETSREELNTTNAELNTVNYELQKRIKELSRLNNDLNNFIESTDIPTLFVDLNGNIRRFTPNIERIINLTDSDIHRNIRHFKTRLLDVDLEKIIQKDIKSRRKSEKPVLTENGSVFLMKIIPYLTENNTHDGVVITFTDITELETLTDEIKQKEKKYQDLFTYINEGFLAAKIVYDKSANIANFEIEEINQFFLNLLNIPAEQAIGKEFKPFFEHYVPEFTANCIEVIESNKIGGIIRYSSPLNKYLEFSVFRSGDNKIGVLTRDVTDTITYQKALKQNKNLLERAQQIARFGYMIYHTDTRKIEWSNETYHIFERDPALGPLGFDKQKEHVHEDDWPVFTRAMKKALERGVPFNIEFRIIAGGRIKYLQSRAEIEKDEAGHTEMIICTLLDISKLKGVQETLRISKNNYADLFNSMIDGFATHEIITDELGEPVDYRFLKVNPAFEKITGLKNSEVRGKRLLEILPDTDISWIQKYGKVALEGTSLEFEDYHEDTGKFFNVHAYSPQKGQFAVIFEDITIRKKIENELKKSEAKYRGLFELIPAGISITDHQGNIIEANKASEQLLDLKRDKQKERHIAGKEWKIIGSDLKPFPPGEFASTRALKENRTITNVEMGIVKEENKVTWINVSATPIDIEDIGVVIIYTDITERKKYESEILLAKEKAEQADKLKTVFLANMSHEIRTPLNAIIGFSDILEKNNVDNTSRQTYLHIIRERGYHLLNIINDLIDFSKIEAGQLELTNRSTNLNQLMRENHEIFKLEIHNKQKENINISFTYGLLDNKACILTDEYRLKEVIGNLLSNAIKFTSEGTIEFGYALENDMLKFHVKDSGIGIPAGEQENIFQRFVQVDNTLTREYGGTGLGLAICKGIVEKMGGKIWVESAAGKGTAFYFTIPYLPCTDKLENTTGSTRYNELPSYDFKKLNVLVVEDDEPSYLFINELLEKTSASNTHALDVNTAMAELKNKKFDIVLLDLHLPGKSGFELLEWMKKSNINIPVLIQSADVMESTREKCRSLGCSEFVPKPVELHQLMNKIEYLTGINS
jgi:PAS domain S-box-containing protein